MAVMMLVNSALGPRIAFSFPCSLRGILNETNGGINGYLFPPTVSFNYLYEMVVVLFVCLFVVSVVGVIVCVIVLDSFIFTV